ncbi:MAG TPA: PhoH family protein, partial [Caulobacteraceae bacterium]|nr:PhoH family protein [Caulobacteraceae bacterium]
MSPETREFVPLSDAALRAVSGPNSRHTALIEDAFHVLVETPGGGVSLAGDARARSAAKRAVKAIADRADKGASVSEADVRAATTVARGGGAPVGGASVPIGRRGAVGPKTAAQAAYLDLMTRHDLVFAAGPAGTGKTFLAVAHGAGLLLRGEV